MLTLASKCESVRSITRSLAANLSAEDQMVQSFSEASPVKWHQAHTTWFFEAFVLRRPFLANYKPFRAEFHRLFNSYYLALGGEIPEKDLRGSFSLPSLDQILEFRAYVDSEMGRRFSRLIDGDVFRRIVLGLNHEQHHQELALADIKPAFFMNPLWPPYKPADLPPERTHSLPNIRWISFDGGPTELGSSPTSQNHAGFCFDNESPRHRVFLDPFQTANRKVNCREYLEFMLDDGYIRSGLWVSDGWETVRNTGWEAPLYWERDSNDETGWRVFTLRGWSRLSSLLDTAVCHVSFFEADAFARWRGCGLPSEAEWESVANGVPRCGNLPDTGRLHPVPVKGDGVRQLFGECWEWTGSPYTACPGYKALPGALGEYNGWFMSGQMSLLGGSCVTLADHIHATYRKFFPPATRWQLTGIRLATH
jgi:ergothioneine biosynthesis protein EgtB